MEKINNSKDLKKMISLLEEKQVQEWHLLQIEIQQFQNNLKPIQLLKNAFTEFSSSSSFKKELLGTAVGLTAGLATKAIAGGFSHNPIKKIIAAVLQLRVANAVSHESGLISSLASRLIKYFQKKSPSI
jgi:hypothetical protein